MKKQLTDAELDELIRLSLKKEAEYKEPDMDEAWRKFVKRKRRKDLEKVSKYVAIAASFLILFAIFAFPTNAKAVSKKIILTVENLLGGNVKNIGVGTGDKEDVVVKEKPVGQKEAVTLEEAKEKAGFPLSIPSYLPDGFALKEALIQPVGKKNIVSIRYEGNNGYVVLIQKISPESHAQGSSFDTEDGRSEQVDIDGQTGNLTLLKDNNFRLIWGTHTSYTLYGKLPSEEILKVARSIK